MAVIAGRALLGDRAQAGVELGLCDASPLHASSNLRIGSAHQCGDRAGSGQRAIVATKPHHAVVNTPVEDLFDVEDVTETELISRKQAPWQRSIVSGFR